MLRFYKRTTARATQWQRLRTTLTVRPHCTVVIGTGVVMTVDWTPLLAALKA